MIAECIPSATACVGSISTSSNSGGSGSLFDVTTGAGAGVGEVRVLLRPELVGQSPGR
jgi:hypothetical protein